VADLDFHAVASGSKTASPSAWEDEVLYFLLCDRFSDGRENTGGEGGSGTRMFAEGDSGSAVTLPTTAEQWREAGRSWVGGTLAGVRSKLDYLSGLGVTALWISPVLKQAPTPAGWTANYHGYATQDFLQVDSHFGSAQELRDLVAAAHARGLRVILDIVLNHAGDVFDYRDRRSWDGQVHDVDGWRDAGGGMLPFTPDAAAAAWPDGAVHPAELHDPGTFTRKGSIRNWDYFPEYVEGDFCSLKDIAHGAGGIDDFRPSPALVALARAYCWWIAYADLDGFRIDTVKHMDLGATRYFASVVHEFAQSLGKDRFLLVGEITGSREQALDTAERTGLDAALGIADVQYRLEATVKGWFRNSALIGKDSHAWLRSTVVTSYDDHDQIRKGAGKARFCADPEGPALALAAMALNALTLGIPCFYYGSEQALDGQGGGDAADRYIREAMFGGEFGAFRSRDLHVFNSGHHLYRELSAILAVRAAEPALRRGRQYLRQISGDGTHFGFPTGFGGPRVRSLIAWSRLLGQREVLCVINNDPELEHSAWVTIDAALHPVGATLGCLYGSDSHHRGSDSHHRPDPSHGLAVQDANGRSVKVQLPPGGVAIFAR
jgi:glycosidase